MATRGEQAKAEQQRQNQKKPRKATAAPAKPDHKTGVSGTARRNLQTSPSKSKGGPALESSATGKPSRKSTRGSSEHVKLGSNLQRRQVRRVHSSSERAARARVR